MKFLVRHQISDLEEEVYEFYVSDLGIEYRYFWMSKRANINGVFGFDYDSVYGLQHKKDLEALDKKYFELYGLDDDHDHWCEGCDQSGCWEKINESCKIIDSYNSRKLLIGTSGPSLQKDHPVKVSDDVVFEAMYKKLLTLELKYKQS